MELVAEPVELRPCWQQASSGIADLRPSRGRNRRQYSCRDGPKGLRDALDLLPQLRRQQVPIVATEHLVAAVAGQGDRHMLPRQRRYKVGRDLRGIGKGLVVDLRKPRDHRRRLLCSHVKFGVLRSEVTGDRLRVLRFVIAGLVKADGEGLHRSRRKLLHQRDHRG